jgi:fucose permease
MKQLALSAYLSRIVVYAGFAATGVGMALPGSVLPTLLVQWQLSDSQAGLFFFMGWMGTSVGALLVRPSRVRSMALGSFLVTLGAVGLAYGTRWSCFGWMAIFGIGLGMAMTAISLLQAGRNFERRAAELNQLNLVWALGACLCPTLAAHSLRVANTHVIFAVMGFFFFLLSLWTLIFERDAPATAVQPHGGDSRWKLSRLRNLGLWPLSLVIVTLLPTGIEASMGAWIASYVQRTEQAITTTVTAGTCFWVGLMLSRLLSSTLLLWRRSERFVLAQSLSTVVIGMILLIATRASLGIIPGVFLIGFGLGPVYPLLLAIALQYSENTLIFFIAGLGSAVLPWMTGIVSTSTSSLRIGLLVPLAASGLMLALGLRQVMRGRQSISTT